MYKSPKLELDPTLVFSLSIGKYSDLHVHVCNFLTVLDTNKLIFCLDHCYIAYNIYILTAHFGYI